MRSAMLDPVKCRRCRLLLRLLLAAARPLPHRLSRDEDTRGKAFVMIGTGLADQLVGNARVALLLYMLLQCGLIVVRYMTAPNEHRLGGKLTRHIVLRRLPTTIQIDRTYDRLERILKIVLSVCTAAEQFPSAEPQIAAEIKLPRKPRQRLTLNETRTHLRELSLGTVRKTRIQIGAGGKLQHSITQKLQTFVMRNSVFRFIGIRRMRQRLIQQRNIIKCYIHVNRKTHKSCASFLCHFICHCFTSDTS